MPTVPPRPDAPLSELIDPFLEAVARRYRGNSLARMARGLHLAASGMGDPPVEQITGELVEEWVQHGPLKLSSMKIYKSYVRSLCGWLVDEGVLAENPIMRADRPPVRPHVRPPEADPSIPSEPPTADAPLSAFIAPYLAAVAERYSSHSHVRRSTLRLVARELGDPAADQLTSADIEAWRHSWRSSQRSQSTMSVYLAFLRGLCQWLVDGEIIDGLDGFTQPRCPTPPADSVSRFIEPFMRASSYRPSTEQHIRSALHLIIRELGHPAPAALTSDRITEWRASLVDRSRGTIKAYTSYLRTFCEWLVDTGELAEHPLPAPPRPEPLRIVYPATDRLLKEYFASVRLAPATTASRRSALEVTLRALGKPALTVQRADIEHWLSTSVLAPATLTNRLSNLHEFFSYLVRAGKMKSDPSEGVRRPRIPRRVPRALTAVDATALVSEAAARVDDDRALLWCLLGLQEGLRRKEIAGLQWSAVDLVEGTIRVVGKFDNERLLPLSDETARLLRAYAIRAGHRSGPVFRSKVNPLRSISPAQVGRVIGDLMRLAGIKSGAHDGRNLHALRHTAATDMLKAGAHLRDVQAVLGHTHLATTEIYLSTEVYGKRAAMGGRRYLPGVRGSVANDVNDEKQA
jgi:integrase/recombinase XerD